MKKLRQRLSVQDIGRVSITPVKGTEGYETRKEYYARLERQEREQQEAEQKRAEAAQRAIEDEMSRPLREAAHEQSQRVKAFFSSSLRNIQEFGLDLSPSDMIGDYVTGESTSQADLKAEQAFTANLAATGCTLSPDGMNRLAAYIESLRFHRQVSLGVVANWRQAISRLISLEAFQPGEISGYTEPQLEPQPERTRHNDAPTMKDLLAVDAGTEEGRRTARQIGDALYEQEMLPLYREWIDLIYRTFNHVVTRKDADLVNAWFATNNKSWLRHESYNECRRYLVSIHHWPDSMLTPEEKTLIAIESLPRSQGESDFSYRRRAQALAR